MTGGSPTSPQALLAAEVRNEIAALGSELAEIEMLGGQARAEAVRHEQKRAQAADRLDKQAKPADAPETAAAYAALVTLTRRAVLMEAQVDVLEGKRKALARHRTALEDLVGRMDAAMEATPDPAEDAALRPSLSRVVLSAQEDLRREIARAMHDGPAQSLTNIVLQAEIVERLLERAPEQSRGEMRQLVSMVQQTLEATKSFIFDVRPMVLDDLGLVPTLRRAARERGRRAHVQVEFESLGTDQRLAVDVESAIFRTLDGALAVYLGLGAERVLLRLDWADELEARLVAGRDAAGSSGDALPDVPTGDVPDAIKQMIQDRHDDRNAALEAAEQAAIVVLPQAALRDAEERAASIGGRLEILAGGGELRLVIPLPVAAEVNGEQA